MTPEDLSTELERLREQRDEEVETGIEDGGLMVSEVAAMGDDLEDQLIDYNFDAVQELIAEVVIRLREVDLEELRAFAQIKFAGDAERVRRKTLPDQARWRVTEQTREAPMAAARQGEESDDEIAGGSRRLEAQAAFLREHLRFLLGPALEEAWAAITEDIWQSDPLADESLLFTLADEIENAHGLWFTCAGELYGEVPGALGEAGEMIGAFEAWMRSQRAG